MSDAPMVNGSPDVPFSVIPNACLQDYSLSLDAYAVLVRVLTLPPNWVFHKSWAQKTYGIGRDKLDRIIRELVAAEYCHFERIRNADGTRGASCFIFTHTKGVFRKPQPHPEKAFVDEKTAENHTLKTPGHWKPAPTNNLKKELEKTYRADTCEGSPSSDAHSLPTGTRTTRSPDAGEGQDETRTGASVAPGRPVAGRQEGASREAGSSTAAAAFDALRVRCERNEHKAATREASAPDHAAEARAERVAMLQRLKAQCYGTSAGRPPCRFVKTSRPAEPPRPAVADVFAIMRREVSV